MQLAINADEQDLLKMLLSKEEVGTRVEIHHCRTYEYKEVLKKREKQLHSMLERIRKASPAGEQTQYEQSGLSD